MIFIGMSLKTNKVSHIAYFNKKYIVDYTPGEYIEVSEGVKTLYGSDFEIQNWLFDGLDMENDIDYVYEDGDHNVIKVVFENGLEA